MNVRELLARLNPKTVRFDVGQGGLPDLTPQDIAAALAFVTERLGREVMCHLYWPDGATISVEQLHGLIREATAREMQIRLALLEIARLEMHTAADQWSERRAHTEHDHARMQILRARVAVQREKQFPAEPEMYPRVRRAVLAELKATHNCPACKGRGHSPGEAADQRTCADCDGTGRIAVSDRDRAELIGRDESRYRRAWRPLYEWMFNHLAQAEAIAARQFWSALHRCPITAAVHAPQFRGYFRHAADSP